MDHIHYKHVVNPFGEPGERHGIKDVYTGTIVWVGPRNSWRREIARLSSLLKGSTVERLRRHRFGQLPTRQQLPNSKFLDALHDIMSSSLNIV